MGSLLSSNIYMKLNWIVLGLHWFVTSPFGVLSTASHTRCQVGSRSTNMPNHKSHITKSCLQMVPDISEPGLWWKSAYQLTITNLLSVLSSRLGFGTNPLDQSRVPRLESAENWRHLQKIPSRSCMKLYDLHDAEVVLPKFQSQHGVAWFGEEVEGNRGDRHHWFQSVAFGSSNFAWRWQKAHRFPPMIIPWTT